ncbi:MAG: methionine--tRNA ligase [Bryobacteraceae bacterium]|nr:methionine--tRNA ligase [Bryobacteraceae bacterium]
MNPKYYLTTPIYYVNAAPHIGHTYTTFAADMIRTYKRMTGFNAVLTSGTDEHGQKVQRAAEKMGQTPEQYTTTISEEFRTQWEKLGLHIDRFLRTTDPRQAAAVGKLYEACKKNGYIYKGSYTGQYCMFDELYVNDAEPGDPCPECGRPTETVTEENLYFKLSAFQGFLEDLLENRIPGHESFIQPEIRRNEILAFLKKGLKDLSISRTSITWGIPVPDEPKHVFYVWFDALMTYWTAVEGEGLWPADLHLVGKEIIRFHALYWPAFLKAAGWELPKHIFAHGWLLFDNDKMSKSKGNIVRPEPIRQVMGADPLRYFLFREIPFGGDGNFSFDALVGRYNSDLANGLGNLLSRTTAMIRQYRGGKIPASAGAATITEEATKTVASFRESFDRFEFHRALEQVWALLTFVDRAIVQYQPWNLSKKEDAESQARLDEILYSSAETLRIVSILLKPVLPEITEKIWAQLGMTTPLIDERIDRLAWGGLTAGQAVGEAAQLFPRLDLKQTVEKMNELEVVEVARQNALLGKTAPVEAPSAEWTAPEGVVPVAAPIEFDDFAKVDLRVAKILTAEKVEKADKLLKLTMDVAEREPRTIVAGIAKAYTPEQLVGRKVVIVANLQPRKLRGIMSNGMIVAASLENTSPVLAGFLEDVPVGARLK